MQFLEKLWKLLENIKILNLSQQKKGETIWCQNQNYHTTNFSTENLVAIEKNKKER